jgi:hypothetical protein
MDCWVQRVATGGRSRVLINPTELFWGILIGRHAKFLLTLTNKIVNGHPVLIQVAIVLWIKVLTEYLYQ